MKILMSFWLFLFPFCAFAYMTEISTEVILILTPFFWLFIYLIWKEDIDKRTQINRDKEEKIRQEVKSNNLKKDFLNAGTLKGTIQSHKQYGIVLSVNEFENEVDSELLSLINGFISTLTYVDKKEYVSSLNILDFIKLEYLDENYSQLFGYSGNRNITLNSHIKEEFDKLLKEAGKYGLSKNSPDTIRLAIYIKGKLIETEITRLSNHYPKLFNDEETGIVNKLAIKKYNGENVKFYNEDVWFAYLVRNKEFDIFLYYFYYYFEGYIKEDNLKNSKLCLNRHYYIFEENLERESLDSSFSSSFIKHVDNTIFPIIDRINNNPTIKLELALSLDEKKGKVVVINELTGIEFEKLLAIYYEKKGYDVQMTKATSDKGVDLIVKKEKSIAIQAKRYKRTVGIKSVQEAFAGKTFYKCEEALVITNSYFTESAIALAKETKVKLIDHNKLIKMMAEINILAK